MSLYCWVLSKQIDHLKSCPKIWGHFFIIHEIPSLNKLTRPDAKAVEQVLIETYGIGNNGQLLNKINSISPKNKIYDDAIIRGKSILKEAEYGDF